MARINIEDSLWADIRFQKLLLVVGDRYIAKGMVLELLVVAQKSWLPSGGLGIPKPMWDAYQLSPELIACGLARDDGDFIYAAGSKEQFAWLDQCALAGSRGGKASGRARRETKEKFAKGSEAERRVRVQNEPSYSSSSSSSSSEEEKKEEEEEELNLPGGSATAPAEVVGLRTTRKTPDTAETWKAYGGAYEARHKTKPVRNQTVNSQMANFVKRIGIKEAPEVARFYVSHNDAFYVRAMHPVSLLLRDAEKFRTEWATGRRMTSADAKMADDGEYHRNQMQRVLSGEL